MIVSDARVKKVFILKHVPNEGAGTLLDYLEREGLAHEHVLLYAGQPLPPVEAVRAALVMGGPMNVDEEDRYPFLKPETEFIRELARRDVPTLGVCLGSQLIAKALGRKVYKAPAAEIGWSRVEVLPEGRGDAIFSAVQGNQLRVLQWHEDTFDLPQEAVLLATHPVVRHQAYRYKKNVYGFQFHLEVDRPMLENWFQKSTDLSEILRDYDSYREELNAIMTAVCGHFFRPTA